ncbi:hypothetical protein [Rufibacter soli]
MKELKQRHLLSSKEFTLRKSGIRVITKTWKENLEYRIRYEDLGFELVKKREKAALLPACAFTFLTGLSLYAFTTSFLTEGAGPVALLWITATLVSMVLAVLAFSRTNRDLVLLTGGSQTLELFRGKPSNMEVDNFILSIHAHIQAYYKNKYGVIEPHLPQDVLIERFGWLREMGILSQEEHEDLWMQLQIKDLLS